MQYALCQQDKKKKKIKSCYISFLSLYFFFSNRHIFAAFLRYFDHQGSLKGSDCLIPVCRHFGVKNKKNRCLLVNKETGNECCSRLKVFSLIMIMSMRWSVKVLLKRLRVAYKDPFLKKLSSFSVQKKKKEGEKKGKKEKSGTRCKSVLSLPKTVPLVRACVHCLWLWQLQLACLYLCVPCVGARMTGCCLNMFGVCACVFLWKIAVSVTCCKSNGM